MDFDDVREYAAAQYHVVARWELLDMGMEPEELDAALADGRLEEVDGDVFLIGGRSLTFEGRCIAATLSVPGSVVSHRTAAMLHGLLPIDERRPIDLTVELDPCVTFTARADDRRLLRVRCDGAGRAAPAGHRA